jgi:hypothetical protein
MKTSIEIRVILTHSKIIGSLLIISGIIGYFIKLDSATAITMITLGSALIGYKQHNEIVKQIKTNKDAN